MLSENLSAILRPKVKHAVRELVEAAGIDVSDWAIDRNGVAINNPNQNIYRSFKWSFGGSGEPIALCIWHEDIDWTSSPPTLTGNTKSQQDDLNALADKAISTDVRSRLGIKIRRTRDFQNAIYEAYSKRLPVRIILVEGKHTDIIDAATDSSKVSFRELDAVPWYPHAFDPYTGSFRIVRGIESQTIVITDPFASIEDPGLDPNFQAYVGDLNATEREALIKTRVGQGPFRDALIARWKGCSVTGCGALELLIASHIKPWSRCTTPAERLGAANGLLLTPNLDKLFDRGFITFDDRFRILFSPKLTVGVAMDMKVDWNMRLKSTADKDMLPFLEWHAQNIFLA